MADNFYLPVWLNKSEFTEVEQVRHERTEEEIRQIATKNFSDYIKDLEEKGIQIISKNVIIKSTGEKYVVSGDLWGARIHCFLSADRGLRYHNARKAE